MRDVRSVVREARREEQSGHLTRAIELYRKALTRQENELDAPDPDLYNQLGDLYLRAGEPRRGVECYVKAVDRLEEQGLQRAAIALCKKILRNAPAHTAIYRRVGRLQARAGLQAEARESFIEFAHRMERAGETAPAFEALQEFVELSGDEEIRSALVDRHLVAGRTDDALAELRLVFRSRTERGEEAVEIRRRIEEIEAGAGGVGIEPRRGAHPDVAGEEPRGAANETAAGAATEGEAEDELAELAAELGTLSNRPDGEERIRRSLPVIDRLLALEPGQMDLLHRKLSYALALGEEERALEAYRQLGEALEARLDGFHVRFLGTHPSGGAATAAVGIEARSASSPRG